MSYIFLLEQGEVSSAECFSDIPQSVLLRLNLTPERCCSNANETASCPSSQSGTTSAPSTAHRGEEKSMSSAGDFPVRTSVQREKEQALRVSEADFGVRWHGLSLKCVPGTYSLRTVHSLWEEDLPWSSVILPKWGMMRDGELWERTMPAHLTSETESGCWVGTPTASMTVRSEEFAKGRIPQPAEFVKRWPTPQAHKTTESGEIVNADGTPWDGKSKPHSKSTGRPITTALADAVKFATPQARDFRTGQQSRWENPERTRNLNDQIGGQLNPSWVEWLMGWPLEWTDLKPSGTGKFQEWLDSHGRFYREGLTNE